MSTPAATRIGDADVAHCSGMTRAEGSPTVFVNNIPWSRQGDKNTTHLFPAPPICLPILFLIDLAILSASFFNASIFS